MKRLFRKSLIPFILIFVLQSCYEDYKKDFEYTATYFAMQDPLRTVLVEDGTDLAIEIGVMLGGKYENDRNESVLFEKRKAVLRIKIAVLPVKTHNHSHR